MWRSDIRTRMTRRLALGFVSIVVILLFGWGSVAAQNDAATPVAEVGFETKVAAVLCEDWSCLEFGDRLDGFTITVVDRGSGEVLDSCVTDLATPFEGCYVTVPEEDPWDLVFNNAETPEGYVYHGSIIAVEGGAHGSVIYLPFHPVEDPEPGHMVVQAALCTNASCDEFAEYLDGFLISAVHPVTGQEYSECMTDNAQQGLDHQCILDVPVKGQTELRWNEDQVPDGYVPFGEPIVSGDPAVTTLAFVPEDEATAVPPTEVPVVGLPKTGSAVGTSDGAPIGVLAGAALALLGLGGIALAEDRRIKRS